MIMDQGKGGQKLEVENMKYLGLIIQKSGKFSITVKDRIEKATKCTYMLMLYVQMYLYDHP